MEPDETLVEVRRDSEEQIDRRNFFFSFVVFSFATFSILASEYFGVADKILAICYNCDICGLLRDLLLLCLFLCYI